MAGSFQLQAIEPLENLWVSFDILGLYELYEQIEGLDEIPLARP